jgi:hypothetical protein
MEDSIVKKGYYAYSLRVDIPHGNHEVINEWLTKYNAAYWIIGEEVSEQNKQHLQCIIWFESRQQMPKLRNWWKGKTSTTKQPVSFTSAKKITSLGKYCKKDNKFVTNLSPEEILKIGNWETKAKKKQKFMDKLYEYAHTLEFVPEEPYNEYASLDDKYEFIGKMLDFYREHNVRPNKSTISYLLWREKYWQNCDWVKNNFNEEKL